MSLNLDCLQAWKCAGSRCSRRRRHEQLIDEHRRAAETEAPFTRPALSALQSASSPASAARSGWTSTIRLRRVSRATGCVWNSQSCVRSDDMRAVWQIAMDVLSLRTTRRWNLLSSYTILDVLTLPPQPTLMRSSTRRKAKQRRRALNAIAAPHVASQSKASRSNAVAASANAAPPASA